MENRFTVIYNINKDKWWVADWKSGVTHGPYTNREDAERSLYILQGKNHNDDEVPGILEQGS